MQPLCHGQRTAWEAATVKLTEDRNTIGHAWDFKRYPGVSWSQECEEEKAIVGEKKKR